MKLFISRNPKQLCKMRKKFIAETMFDNRKLEERSFFTCDANGNQVMRAKIYEERQD